MSTWRAPRYLYIAQLLYLFHQRLCVYPSRRRDLFFSFPFRSRWIHLYLQSRALNVDFSGYPIFHSPGLLAMKEGRLWISVPYRNCRRAVFAVQRFVSAREMLMRSTGLSSWNICVEQYFFYYRHCGTSKLSVSAWADSLQTATGIEISMQIARSGPVPMFQSWSTIAQMIWRLLSDAFQRLWWNCWKPPSLHCSWSINQKTM